MAQNGSMGILVSPNANAHNIAQNINNNKSNPKPTLVSNNYTAFELGNFNSSSNNTNANYITTEMDRAVDILDINVPEWTSLEELRRAAAQNGEDYMTQTEGITFKERKKAQQQSEEYAVMLAKERTDLTNNLINYAVFVFVAVYGVEIDRRTNLLIISVLFFALFTLTSHIKTRFNMAMQKKHVHGSGKLIPTLNVRLMDIITYFIAFLLIQIVTVRMRPVVSDGHFSVAGLILAGLVFVVWFVGSHVDELRIEVLHDQNENFPVFHEKQE